MKYGKMTPEQMLFYVKRMDANFRKYLEERDRILQEIKDMQNRKEILSWDEIASAVAYPKPMPDSDKIGGGSPDEYKLFHQAERISKIYISQMEELFEELERLETEITKYRYVNRCMNQLDPEDREVIEKFTRQAITYDDAMQVLHFGRTTLYKIQKRAIDHLTVVYNNS